MAKLTNNIEKKMSAGGPEVSRLDMNQFIKLASETAAEERELSDYGEMEYYKALKKFLRDNPGSTEDDFKRVIVRIPLEGGGSAKIIKMSDYKNPDKKVKELNLASLFTPSKTLASLTESERDAVNQLLKLTFGKND